MFSIGRISERFLLPVLEAILATFPFVIQGFHADNGSEFINHREHLNPYLNYHCPCLFPVPRIDDKGRIKKQYPYTDMDTPYGKLKSLPNARSFLKPGITFEHWDAIALSISDKGAAQQMNEAKQQLYQDPLRTGSKSRMIQSTGSHLLHPRPDSIYGLE